MAERKGILTRGEGYHQFYANNLSVNISNWDALLEFGKISQVTDTEIHVVNEVGIYVGLGQLKAIAKTLSAQVEQYEKQMGEIPMEPKKK